ncbi:PGF-CTERM sorting domain-containing protein [Haloarcula sp. Atlit-47R]|nr:PGF-CTERM sorting domain-containing protein [Haloarcula sp. Atlit-47R]
MTEVATTPASGPGFTVAVALIALVAAALLAVRRNA